LVSFCAGDCAGDCADWDQWLAADRGIKPERTEVEEGALAEVEALLGEVAARRGKGYAGFERRGNIHEARGEG
jgi:hypothetical protein